MVGLERSPPEFKLFSDVLLARLKSDEVDFNFFVGVFIFVDVFFVVHALHYEDRKIDVNTFFKKSKKKFSFRLQDLCGAYRSQDIPDSSFGASQKQERRSGKLKQKNHSPSQDIIMINSGREVRPPCDFPFYYIIRISLPKMQRGSKKSFAFHIY